MFTLLEISKDHRMFIVELDGHEKSRLSTSAPYALLNFRDFGPVRIRGVLTKLAEGEFEPFLRPISGEVKKFHVGQLIRNGNLLRNVAHAQFTREDLAAWLARDIEQFMRGEEPLRAESA